jgi:hypothetical protein
MKSIIYDISTIVSMYTYPYFYLLDILVFYIGSYQFMYIYFIKIINNFTIHNKNRVYVETHKFLEF